MDIDLALNLLLSTILGFMIGLQREIQVYFEKSQEFGGARTFAILSLIGFLSAIFSNFNQFILPVTIFGIIIFLTYIHIKAVKITKDIGTTTEFAAIATFFVGVSTYFFGKKEAVFIAILILFLLELKGKIKSMEGKISKTDLSSAVLFFLMTFVILPILPDKAIDPFGVVNLYQIWLMVVLISGISFLGYISVKTIGVKKGFLFTGFFGGLTSSTAVAISLAKKSALNKELTTYLAVAIGIASSTMFFRVLIEIFFVNLNLLEHLFFPYMISAVSGYIYLYFLYKRSRVKLSQMSIEFKNPLELKESLKIGILFGVIFGLVSVAKNYFGDIGIYALSIISGLTDVDAITLSLAKMSKNMDITTTPATIGIVLASISNTFTKLLIVFYLGGKKIGLLVFSFFVLSALPLLLYIYIFLS